MNFWKTSLWSTSFLIPRKHPKKSANESKNHESLKNRSMRQEKDIGLLLTELLSCSSVFWTLLWSTLCISTPCSGSSDSSQCQWRPHFLLMFWKKDFKTWMNTLPTLCIRMFADLCLKNINCCFLSFWQSKLNKGIIKLIWISGGIYCQDPLDRLQCLLILLAGFQKISGLTFTDNFMVLDYLIAWRISKNILWTILINGGRFSIVLRLMKFRYLSPTTVLYQPSRNWS